MKLSLSMSINSRSGENQTSQCCQTLNLLPFLVFCVLWCLQKQMNWNIDSLLITQLGALSQYWWIFSRLEFLFTKCALINMSTGELALISMKKSFFFSKGFWSRCHTAPVFRSFPFISCRTCKLAFACFGKYVVKLRQNLSNRCTWNQAQTYNRVRLIYLNIRFCECT